MLAIAQNKKIYNVLIEGDLLDILKTRTFAADVLIAADVFIYFGDLSVLLQQAFTQTKDQGWLAFSCEEGPDDDTFHLATTGRYQHPKAYIIKVLAAAGWHLMLDERVTLREQKGQPVLGRVYLCQKKCKMTKI
jgi:predicted TPR repeat methyltransferase